MLTNVDMAAAASVYPQQQIAYHQSQAPEPRLPELDAIEQRLQMSVNSLAGLRDKLKEFADRAFGDEPPQNSSGNVRPAPMGLIGSIRDKIEGLEMLLAETDQQVSRLHRLL